MSLVRHVRMKVAAGVAKPGPAIGQALGPLGINMMEFCKKFNEETKNIVQETPMTVVLSAFSDRTFTFDVRAPSTSYLLKQCAGIKKGASRPGSERCGKVGLKAVHEIALVRQGASHTGHLPLEGLCRSVIATADSMGLEVVDDRIDETEAGAEQSAAM